MNGNEVKEACAKLDGWIHHFNIIHGEITDEQVEGWRKESGEEISRLPNYLKSYDDIIPLIKKQVGQIKADISAELLMNMDRQWSFDATPYQLAEALLRATNNWGKTNHYGN